MVQIPGLTASALQGPNAAALLQMGQLQQAQQAQAALAAATAGGDADKESQEKQELRRARRMLSNRESARRSRKRKQEHLNKLESEVVLVPGVCLSCPLSSTALPHPSTLTFLRSGAPPLLSSCQWPSPLHAFNAVVSNPFPACPPLPQKSQLAELKEETDKALNAKQAKMDVMDEELQRTRQENASLKLELTKLKAEVSFPLLPNFLIALFYLIYST